MQILMWLLGLPHSIGDRLSKPLSQGFTSQHGLEITSRFHSPKALRPLDQWLQRFYLWRRRRIRYSFVFMAGVVLSAHLITALSPFFVAHTYALGSASTLLPDVNQAMAKKLKFDTKQQTYDFTYGQAVPQGTATNSTGSVAATAPKDPTKGLSVTDSLNKVDFKMTPKFKLMEGKQDGNRVIYPLWDGTGWAVYTMLGTGVKEDIVLNYANDDRLSLEYELGLSNGLEARQEPNGSIGVYGNKLFSSNISASTEKDAALLQKARKNATKDTFLFSIPKPVINDTKGVSPNVTASYELKGSSLRVNVKGLKTGSYPLTIDPSIYVVTASQFMYGNNETNVNFDVDNKMIRKGRLTGARFDSWQNTQNLPIGSWGSGSVASGGYIYQVGGASFSGQVFSTQGSATYTVPNTVTSITVKIWGGGGGAGSGGTSSVGGSGGGGGYVTSTHTVTGGENLTVYVGGGGSPGPKGSASGGGGGGGYSSLYRGGNLLALAAGGGGGGGGTNSTAPKDGGAGGAGGDTTGQVGVTVGNSVRGGAGTPTAGGAGGTSSYCAGTAGTSLTGGLGGGHAVFNICTQVGNGGAGGLASGGAGGGGYTIFADGCGGGGGSAGFWGGGGAGDNVNIGCGGGGSGSSKTEALATGVSYTPLGGSPTAQTPGNASDPYRGSAGNGGTCTGGNNCTGTVGSTGLVVISTNAAGNPATKSLNWAKFDPGDGTVVQADPGNGQCSGWCTTSTYDMPTNRSNFSLVAYNGYLYAMGGNDENGPTTLNKKYKTVYVAKLGANGEPRLWNPDSSDPSTWSYWYQSTGSSLLPSERINGTAVAYNNKMYFIGGLDNSSANGAPTSTVWVANILPSGKLGAWSTSTALSSGGPSTLFGMTGLVYNDRLYVVGGATTFGGTPVATVYYIKINSDGSLASSWVQTSSFTTGRINMGGTNAVVWNGYLYVTGGCSAVNANGTCATVVGDTQIASINADGSLDSFIAISGLSESRIGFGMLAWRDNIYVVGGCTTQDSSSGACLGGIQAGIDYGHLNAVGDVSSVNSSVASGGSTCVSGSGNSSCNIPATRIHAMVAVVNNYIYVMGGCSTATCTTVTNTIYFAGLTPNGTIQEYPPNSATCPTGSSNSSGWCATTTNLPGNLAGAAVTTWQGAIYLIGGVSASGTVGNVIYNSTIASTGVPGTWANNSLTVAGVTAQMAYASATTRANPGSFSSSPANIYIIGGCTSVTGTTCNGSGSVLTTTYKCNVSTAGALSSCSTGSQGSLPAARAQAGIATYGNYVYVVGGTNVTAEQSTIYEASFDSSNNLASWSADPSYSLSTALRGASVFAYNGYLYIVGGINGNTLQNTIIYGRINTSNGNIDTGGLVSSASTTTAKFATAGVAASGYAYIVSGCSVFTAGACTTITNTIQNFRLHNNDSGSPSTWVASTNTSGTDRWYHSAAVVNGYLYLAGGCTSGSSGTNDCSAVTANVEFTPIDSSGAIGSWTNATSGLTVAAGGGKLVAIGNSLYYIGGNTANYAAYNTAIYYTTPNSGTGQITSWTTSAKPLTNGRTNFGVAVWNNRIFVVGGRSTASSTGCNANKVCNDIYISDTVASGGDIGSAGWTTSSRTILGSGRLGLSAVAYAGNLYIIGGSTNDGTSPALADVQYASIDTTNTSSDNLGALSYGTSLPHGLFFADALAVNGYIYLFGGMKDSITLTSSGNCNGSTIVAPVSANTSAGVPKGIGSWGEHGSWTSTNGTLTTGAIGAATAYYEGKVYLTGGACNYGLVKTASSTRNIQQTALLSQPQVAKYSISFDTDDDVYPTNYLLNGYNSYSGAKWQMNYRSMSDPLHVWSPGTTGQSCSTATMSDWGQQTSVANVPLGTVGTYTPLDASGSNMSCARYYYFNVTADDTQALSFPEDVTATHGPSITDLTLRFTAAPSKRLMHGRTFIGGIQMPDDTPYYTN